MRFNQEALKYHASLPCEKEGKLAYKAPKEGYRYRWIKLRGNLLFYMKVNEYGFHKSGEGPVDVLVLEGCKMSIEPPDSQAFVFSIECLDESSSKKHLFGCQSLTQCREWLEVLEKSSHAFMKAKMQSLQAEVERLQSQKRSGSVNQAKNTFTDGVLDTVVRSKFYTLDTQPAKRMTRKFHSCAESTTPDSSSTKH